MGWNAGVDDRGSCRGLWRAFSPRGLLGPWTWGGAPDWYVDGPLALGTVSKCPLALGMGEGRYGR